MLTQPEEFDELDEGSLFEHFRFEADAGQTLTRIDKFLVNRMVKTSRNRIQQAADAGSIVVNGNPVKSNYKVKPGDIVSIVLDYPRHEFKLIPEDIPLDVVYEDDQLMVVNKPAGLVVHPGHGNYTGTLVNALAWRFRDLPMFNSEDPRPGLVHRIDKDTSGLLVVAKTEIAKTNLALQFFEKSSRRKYQALVWGLPKEKEGTITGNIGRSLKNRLVFQVFPEGDQGKHAVTHYKVSEELGYVSMVECVLETGRTHQIRVHMKYIGHPVIGDKLYGRDTPLDRKFAGQLLHAAVLGFAHPADGHYLEFTSELPAYFSLLKDE